MKKTIINIIAGTALVAGLAASAVAPWWAVWFIALPVAWAGAVALIKTNTRNIEEA